MLTKKQRFQGALLGLATGDALGTTLEFKPPGTFTPITDLNGGGPFRLAAGQWTDDTSMALCLAESLIECKGMNLSDQMERYCRWYRNGHLSSIGYCFDIGNTTSSALLNFEQTGQALSGSTNPYSAGNGSIMRLAPVPMLYASDMQKAVDNAALSSRTTHGAAEAVDAARYYAALLVGALNGESKDKLLAPYYGSTPDFWLNRPLSSKIGAIAQGFYKNMKPPQIAGTGYVVKSLEAALWAFYKTNTFKKGALMAVNLGDDADTTGAVYGQIAGAYYGIEGIPADWQRKITLLPLILQYADKLLELSEQVGERVF